MPDLADDLPTDLDEDGGQESYVQEPEDDSFDQNLAAVIEANDELGERALDGLAEDLLDLIEADRESRAAWDAMAAKGLRLMGLTDDAPVADWMSRVHHPVLSEACVRFQSQAISEVFPPAGPAKPKILGDETDETRRQGDRVADYINYIYTEILRESYDQEEKALLHLPREGSVFVRLYWDEARQRPGRALIKASDLIVPYEADSLATAARITHSFRLHENEVRRLQATGFWRDVELDEPGYSTDSDSQTQAEADDAQSKSTTESREGDAYYDFYECQAEIDLPGFEFDYPLPYIVVIERGAGMVMAIYRNWRREDNTHTRRDWIAHRKFIPTADGFYAYGLLHLIGGLVDGATGCVRALLDAAQLSNLRGGFLAGTVDASKIDQSPLKPGERRVIPMAADDIRKAIIDIQYHEPSQTLFNLLGFLVEAAQRFASTADLMVGDADNKAPVGTTIALIEQGSKVYSAIHGRLHRSWADELRIMSEIIHEYTADDAVYPYAIDGDAEYLIRPDFDDRVDIAPVSDPRIFSQTQRIAIIQAELELEARAPELYDRYELHRRMLESLNVGDIDEILIDPRVGPGRMDAVSEGMAMLHMKPVRAYPDQVHQAHMQIHTQWFQSLPPDGQKVLQPTFMTHMGEHLAWDYRVKIQQFMGVPLPPPPDFHSARPDRMVTQELPPEIEAQIDMAAAQAAQMMAQAFPPPPSPEQQKADEQKAKLAIEQQKLQMSQEKHQMDAQAAQQDMAHDDQEFVSEESRKAQSWAAEEARKASAFEAEQARKDAATTGDLARADVKTAGDELRSTVRAQGDEERAKAKAKADAEVAKKRATAQSMRPRTEKKSS